MTDPNRRANLQLEVEKGNGSLRAAQLCLQAELFDDAVSRAYYAAFHYVQALLFTEGLESRSHAGAHDLFYLHFVRTDRVPRRFAKLFAGLQKYREQADYSRAFHFEVVDASQEVANAAAICEHIKEQLAAGGWLV